MDTSTESTTDEEYRARAAALAKMLRSRPERHHQNVWIVHAPENECGTTACVAGWAALWKAGAIEIAPDGTMTWGRAGLEAYDGAPWDEGAQWLGLDDYAAGLLFYSGSNTEAVRTLELLGSGELARDADAVTFWAKVRPGYPYSA